MKRSTKNQQNMDLSSALQLSPQSTTPVTVRKRGSIGSGTTTENIRKLILLFQFPFFGTTAGQARLPRVQHPYIQHGSREVSSLQVGTAQVGVGQVAAAQIGHLEIDVAKIQAGKVGSTEIQTLEKPVNPPKMVTKGKGEVWTQKS